MTMLRMKDAYIEWSKQGEIREKFDFDGEKAIEVMPSGQVFMLILPIEGR